MLLGRILVQSWTSAPILGIFLAALETAYATFAMTNIAPQARNFNASWWFALERRVRDIAI